MRRLIHGVGLVLAIALMTSVGVVLPLPPGTQPEAAAADPRQFDAGMIITDTLFYDGTSMNAAEVQRFLDERGSSCVPGAMPCLKDYRGDTRTWARDSYCTGYGTQTQSAAEIIAEVGRSCGVSPKVLLVLLQKEQSLVTRNRPTDRSYEIATGYGCPDAAPCSAEYYGFFNQVYRAARQYKVYQAHPARYGYQAGRSNFVSWHPNSTCGGSQVFIQNQATAGLYIYTPHQPNSAIVSGAPDSCSSGGNLNFWSLYTDWFGSTRGIAISGGIASVWNTRGGLNGPGAATGPETWNPANGGGWTQTFRNGIITYTQSQTGTFQRAGTAFTGTWQQAGGQGGSWGWPVTDETCTNGTCTVTFQNVTATWTAATGVTTTPR